MDHLIIKPIPVPKTGPVQKLKLEIAPECATVFVEQTHWPRQKENPRWRIEVVDIDSRLDLATQDKIKDACEQIARCHLAKWLQEMSPLLSVETVSWSELVRLCTEQRTKITSPYQHKRKRRAQRLQKLFGQDISVPDQPSLFEDPVDDLQQNKQQGKETHNDK